MQVQPLCQEDPLEQEMATHFSILAWEIPWIEEPGGLQSMGSQRVRQGMTEHACTVLMLATYFEMAQAPKQVYIHTKYI